MNRNTLIIASLLVALIAGGAYYFWMTSNNPKEIDQVSEVVTPEPEPLIIPQAEQIAAIERQFITDMIPHHTEAVAAAQQLIDSGTNNAEVLKLAKDIVTTQKAEINLMKEWHITWYEEVYKDNGTYQPMMRNISNLSGIDRDKAFLEDMIEHHLVALNIVQASAPQFVRPELRELSQNIASTQSEEVVAMKILLRQI